MKGKKEKILELMKDDDYVPMKAREIAMQIAEKSDMRKAMMFPLCKNQTEGVFSLWKRPSQYTLRGFSFSSF
mgnify:CR=1 FL=1